MSTPSRDKPSAVHATACTRGAADKDSLVLSSTTFALDSGVTREPIPAPTLPFLHFKLAIRRLKAIGDLPHRIDRSAWSNKQFQASGSLIVPTFQFLRLIDDEGRPLDALTSTVASFDTEIWSQHLAAILRFAYSGILTIGIERSTPKDLLDLFREHYGLDAVRGRMAVSFFIHATRESELVVGPFLSANTKSSSSAAPMTEQKDRTMMLGKLPQFDEAWSNELKLAWFTAFNELVSARS